MFNSTAGNSTQGEKEGYGAKENQYEKSGQIEIQYFDIPAGNDKNDTFSCSISFVSCHNECIFASGADTCNCGIRESGGRDI